MRLDGNPTAPADAADWAALLRDLAGPTPKATLDSALSDAGKGPTTSTFFPTSASYPRWYVCEVADTTIVLLGGCETNGHGLRCIAGYAGGIGAPTSNPVNSYFEDWATLVIDQMASLGYGRLGRWIFAGYSMGGATAQLLACRARVTTRAKPITVISFGSPQPSYHDALRPLQDCQAARWMYEHDPVPLVPPRTTDSLLVPVVFPLTACLRFAQFALGAGGMEVSETSHVEPAFRPDTAALTAVSSLAAWLVSSDTDQMGPHGIGTYQVKLGQAAVLLGSRAGNGIKPAGSEAPDSESKKNLTAAERMVVDQMREQEASQHRAHVNIPESLRARVVVDGPISTVYVGETPISFASRRRSAQSLARKYNAALEAALIQGITSKEGFLASVQAFFDQADSPTGGVTPRLPSNLPGG